MSNRGYNETLMVPSNHKDNNGLSLQAFDNHFRALNNGLLSVAQNLSGMHAKVTKLESKTITEHNALNQRVEQLETALADLSKKFNDVLENKAAAKLADLPAVKKAVPKKKDAILVRSTNMVLTGKNTKSKASSFSATNRVPSLDTPDIDDVGAKTPAVEPTVEPTLETTPETTLETTLENTVETLTPAVENTVETVTPDVEPTLTPAVEPTLESTLTPAVEPTLENTVEPTNKTPAKVVATEADSTEEELSDLDISDSEEEKPVKKQPIKKQPVKQLVKQPIKKTAAKKNVGK